MLTFEQNTDTQIEFQQNADGISNNKRLYKKRLIYSRF
jgi:hypothetical protein